MANLEFYTYLEVPCKHKGKTKTCLDTEAKKIHHQQICIKEMITVVLQAEGKLQMEFKRITGKQKHEVLPKWKIYDKYGTFKIMLFDHNAKQLEFNYLNIYLVK